MHDAFVAFFVGLLAGGCLGIITAGFMAAVRQSEDRREREFEQYREEDNGHDTY